MFPSITLPYRLSLVSSSLPTYISPPVPISFFPTGHSYLPLFNSLQCLDHLSDYHPFPAYLNNQSSSVCVAMFCTLPWVPIFFFGSTSLVKWPSITLSIVFAFSMLPWNAVSHSWTHVRLAHLTGPFPQVLHNWMKTFRTLMAFQLWFTSHTCFPLLNWLPISSTMASTVFSLYLAVVISLMAAN